MSKVRNTARLVVDATGGVSATAPTTAQVLNATAAASAGSVGTYALARFAGGTGALNPGATSAGSALRFTNISGIVGPTPSGTWRLMGAVGDTTYDSANGGSLWLRIS